MNNENGLISYLKKKLVEKDRFIINSYKKFGRIFEKFLPFTKDFEWDKDKLMFVGPFIDFICFGIDKITFIEVKTGNSQLTKNQSRIKRLIEEGKVEFREVRYND